MPTVVKTPGAADANAYADLTDLQAWADSRPHAPDLTGYTDDAKSAALIDSARLIDGLDPYGSVTYVDGALRFPRTGIYDRDGRPYAVDAIPGPIEDGNCETALQLLEVDRRADNPMLGVAVAELGDGMSFEADKTDRPREIPDTALRHMSHLFRDAGTAGSSGSAELYR